MTTETAFTGKPLSKLNWLGDSYWNSVGAFMKDKLLTNTAAEVEKDHCKPLRSLKSDSKSGSGETMGLSQLRWDPNPGS